MFLYLPPLIFKWNKTWIFRNQILKNKSWEVKSIGYINSDTEDGKCVSETNLYDSNNLQAM